MFEENVATTRRFYEEAWNKGNLGVLDDACAEGFVDHDPMVGDVDLEGVKELISGYREAFPDIRITIEDVFAAGDKVVTRWAGQGTFENEIMGVAPTGESGEPVPGISIDRYNEDGKVIESWGQWDTLRFLRNIGVVPEGVGTATGS